MIAVGLAALAGGGWGLVSDRIGARWPAHEDASIRPLDWRTGATVIFGALALALLVRTYGVDASSAAGARDLVVLGVYVVPLVLLFATDLDQRLLPDVITWPLVAYAAVVGFAGINPLIEGGWPGMIGPIAAAIVIPLVAYLPSIPFGPGALGLGDVKLLVSVGLMLGFVRELGGLMGAAILVVVVLGLLLATRRITRRSYVPFGPFLIIAAVWGILLPA